jgi:hypothetical protein
LQETKEAVSKDLDKKKQRIKESAGNVNVKTKIMIGYAADKIMEFAEDEKPDMIIIGNTGLGGLS